MTKLTKEETPPPVNEIDELPPPVAGPVWQDYGAEAIQTLYPNLRRGLEWEWGRLRDEGTEVPQHMLHWSDKLQAYDAAALQAAAEGLMNADPYAHYTPRKSLHAGQESGHAEGERHVQDSEKRSGRYTPPPPSGMENFDPTGGKKPPADPHFDKDGNRKK